MGHIFISYSHKDTDYAHRLADALQKEGLEFWIDERLDYGSQWPHEIQKQLDSCSAFIVIMSPRSFESEWVQSELQRAKRKLKPVFPMLLEGDEPWLSVESTQYYDVRNEKLPDEKFFAAIKEAIFDQAADTEIAAAKPKARATSQKPVFRKSYLIAIVAVLAVILAALGIPPLLKSSPTEEASTPTLSPSATASIVKATATPEQPSETSEPEATPVADPNEIIDERGVPMRLIPAGEFEMGSNTSSYTEERPAHTVYLDRYYIDTFEVTNARYKACVDAGVCQPPQETSSATRSNYYGNPDFADYPIVYVDWDMAVTYCEWRGGELPTEAQWEKAARGTDGRSYPWGEGIDAIQANYNYNIGDTTPVGNYEAGKSPYGVYDMSGNVWEWVADWYSGTYYQGSPISNPTGPESGQYHGLRGGSWANAEEFVRTFTRGWDQLEYFETVDFGFRCANSSPHPEEISDTDPDGNSISMRLVPAGEFEMGSNVFSQEQPIHDIYLDDFYIDTFEVTNALYRACEEAGVCDEPKEVYSASQGNYYFDTDFDNYPVIFVDWDMAVNYCENWRDAKLPTEAEWEKAARGEDAPKYPWGEDTDCYHANYWAAGAAACIGDTTPVGSYEKGISPYGVYDMAGNVWEWVNDSYNAIYYGSLPDGFANPPGPARDLNAIILRGGGWDSGVNGIRSAYRGYQAHTYYSNNLGFRCAKDAP